MQLLKLLAKVLLMVSVPAYVFPYITFALAFERMDWLNGTNEVYGILYTMTTTVIFMIMFTFIMPPIIEATFNDYGHTNQDICINNEVEDEAINCSSVTNKY